MINMESKQGRRVVGRLESGANIVEGLLGVCQKHSVNTGQLQGIGYLRNASLSHDTPENSTDNEPLEVGICHVISLTGNISMQSESSVLHLQVLLLETKTQTLHAGRLVGGEVMDVEFAIHSVDDFSLLRSEDSDRLGQWVQIQPHLDTLQSEDTERTEFFPGRMTSRSRYEIPDYDLEPDDRLDHPRLGECTIVDVHDLDRVSIRLDSGRVVELHLGMFDLHRTDKGKGKGKRKSFDVRLRKRP